jgi:hypothetical protein
MSAQGRANALKILNTYRFISGLPDVTTDPVRNQKSQACALIMDANNDLNHFPPSNWLYNTDGGYEAAGKSNISSGQAVRSIDLYMSDFGAGNAASLGHRRWFLSNQLGPVGIGSTTGGSCHWVIGGTGNAGKSWQAYPPPGPIPLQAIAIPGTTSVDSTGWSIQAYNSAFSLTGATVTVTDNGVNAPVTVTQLLANYGSLSALRFNPQGWTSQAGHTYDVTVTLANATVINYQVQPINCP